LTDNSRNKHGYVPIFRRRRMGATDYRARRKMITSSAPLLAVRVSSKNVSAQFIRPKAEGDHVLSAAHSRNLRKLGWKGSSKSVPACYLLGLLAGKRAKEQGVEKAYLYNGLSLFVNGSRVAALVKGVKDAGVDVPMSDEAIPSEDRLSGKATAEYAKSLQAEDKDKYSKMFSGLIRTGFKPEEYEENASALKRKIMEEAGEGKKGEETRTETDTDTKTETETKTEKGKETKKEATTKKSKTATAKKKSTRKEAGHKESRD
jgi:large subunit ribosomal protein L18